ncbi:hypothetical protein BerOc1_00733 [Pseudodesulfovibrio hydrargyri]|uniref:Universal stress protein family protein n=2 Tax=Pseudodesulfovibrio hydrargyri TaxID=2125990 RepID=A0A1J5N9G2_9BACT|nr:hypothetical protein BerOc1_00733 [Pseudodesulfovibrio hydrargyri]
MALFNSVKRMVDKHYAAQAAANCNTCSVGTWVVCHENHLLEKSGGSSMKTFFKRISGNHSQTVIPAPAAATAAASAAADCVCNERQQCKILIVCKGQEFSRGIADYAVDMACKTRSSLVALNIDESGKDFDGFRSQAQRNIEYFNARAADAGLAFSHEIQQGDENAIVARMHEKDPSFRYVMDDSAAVCKNRRSIPVYTRATLRAK